MFLKIFLIFLFSKAFEKLKQIENNNKLDLTDSFKNVTLLFADIVNFTKYSSSVTPNDVVLMLRELFTEFDKTCQTWSLQGLHDW